MHLLKKVTFVKCFKPVNYAYCKTLHDSDDNVTSKTQDSPIKVRAQQFSHELKNCRKEM